MAKSESSGLWVWKFQPFSARSEMYCHDARAKTPLDTGRNLKSPRDFEWNSERRPAAGEAFGVIIHDANRNQVRFGVGYKYYVPAEDDLAIVDELYPDGDSSNPNWTRIETELVVAGQSSRDLRSKTAPVLIRELQKARRVAVEPVPTASGDNETEVKLNAPQSKVEAYQALLRMLTGGLTDERFEQAAAVLMNQHFGTDEKLIKIDELIRIPPTASAQQLGDLLGITKQAVSKTGWWVANRKGEKANEIGRRHAGHRERSKGYQDFASDEGDE